MVEIAGGVRRAEVVGQPFRLLAMPSFTVSSTMPPEASPLTHPERDGLRTVVAARIFAL